MNRTTLRTTLGTLLAIAVVGLAGCTSDTETPDAATTSTTSPSASASSAPVSSAPATPDTSQTDRYASIDNGPELDSKALHGPYAVTGILPDGSLSVAAGGQETIIGILGLSLSTDPSCREQGLSSIVELVGRGVWVETTTANQAIGGMLQAYVWTVEPGGTRPDALLAAEVIGIGTGKVNPKPAANRDLKYLHSVERKAKARADSCLWKK